MNIKFFLAFILVLSFISSYGFTEEWTIDQTVNTALTVSNMVAVEQFEADEANLDAISAEKGWFPRVSFSADANYVSEVMKIKMPLKKIRFGDYDSYNINLSFNQLLYDGGRLKALKEVNDNRSMMSLYNAEAVGLAVELQAKTAFYRVVMTESAYKAAEQSLIEAENHYSDVQAFYSQGMALENDVLRAKLRNANAEMELVSRKADLEKSKAEFRKVTGLAPDEEVTVKWDEDTIKKIDMTDFEKAFESRPEFKAFDAAIAVSEKTVKAARADVLPNVGLFGGFYYGKPGLDMPANRWMHYFASGVLLNWNVWDWGKTKREIEKAYINRKKILKNRDDFNLLVSREISEAFINYEEAVKREKLASEAAEFAQKQLELTHSAYREGMATEIDYDNAHTAFTKATFEKSISKAARLLCASNIEYVLGIRYSGGKK